MEKFLDKLDVFMWAFARIAMAALGIVVFSSAIALPFYIAYRLLGR